MRMRSLVIYTPELEGGARRFESLNLPFPLYNSLFPSPTSGRHFILAWKSGSGNSGG